MSVSSINDLTDQNRDGSPDNIPLHMWVAFCMGLFEVDEGWESLRLKFMLFEFRLSCNQSLMYALNKKAKWFGWVFFFSFFFSLLCSSALSMIGLILIALGTGGIKPCVSAFGGDQFEDDQVTTSFRFSIVRILLLMFDYYNTLIICIFRHGHYCSVPWVAEEGAR